MTTRLITQAYDDALRPSGITSGQFSTLGMLFEQGALPILKLAEAMEIDRTTLTRNLRLMEKHELVVSRPDPADKRIKLVEITERGMKALERAAPYWLEVQTRLVEGLGRSNIDRLFESITELRDLAQPSE